MLKVILFASNSANWICKQGPEPRRGLQALGIGQGQGGQAHTHNKERQQNGKAWSTQAGWAGGQHLYKGGRRIKPEGEVVLGVESQWALSGWEKTEASGGRLTSSSVRAGGKGDRAWREGVEGGSC